ncbi:MAG: phosphoribosylaminoimidazolesuccinocarboxamide synthase [Rickettsiaceae bacterium]|jgi:phosphoribosylaminoimidazole-succinocarboxamide synthase|nr:phosphoribosylaminoimidazolesuccinocarboxamide synthase [Alphaproteobacteria bacterium]MBN8522769.1 phosphoribosylaminoimidazolesuccinocarboxamide synthase [Rickettsiales bacterium]MCP5362978.1 phosphoribosylaminoimidazolesuccinocarboxamide synthase [Rickettsiaceae bacterium]MCP5375245.1 phosphoribosylaminoimidazolesuccinocarboxamide synthase [Rickettsiaceae bacterium]MCP5377838.1 phosphoribosylaminoimidazolesuccinocarboxamide synthase [Rickettsiaceae bacterium]
MKEKIYTGASKTLYQADEDYALIMSFNDTLKLQDKSSIVISGKGVINNSISAFLMQKLELIGVETHFIQKNNMRQQLIQFVDVYPVQIYVSSLASGRYVTDFGMEDGFVFDSPIIDFRVKNGDLNYPIINEHQIYSFSWLSEKEIKNLKKVAIRVHDFLTGLFAGIGIRLVDIKLEFGRVFNGEEYIIMLTDEISPDTCKLWDMYNNEKLCYEIAETNPDLVISAYQEVLKRLNIKTDV